MSPKKVKTRRWKAWMVSFKAPMGGEIKSIWWSEPPSYFQGNITEVLITQVTKRKRVN